MGKKLFFMRVITLWIALNFFSFIAAETPSCSPGIREITGEIVAITSGTVRINHDGLIKEYPLAFGVKIICNGVTGNWKSLLPITSEAFFEANISLDDTNHVMKIDGFYKGEECIIRGWFYDAGQLNLQMDPVEKKSPFCIVVGKDARLPKEAWLHDGQLVFIIYNRKGEIRGIYLPD